jgi:hypothetical protein
MVGWFGFKVIADKGSRLVDSVPVELWRFWVSERLNSRA